MGHQEQASQQLESSPGVAPSVPSYQLKELSPRHRQVAALLVQGVERQVVAELTGFAPEYVTWLGRQPVMQQFLRELEEYANIRLVALADKRTDVIAEVMEHGGPEERLKAAKLQMEATGLIGRPREAGLPRPEGRLEALADRLLTLLQDKRAVTHEQAVQDAEVVEERRADA
jgi:hypothetical protein